MNKKLVAVAVAAGLALPMVSAHAVDVADKKLEVYGKLHMSLQSNDDALDSTNDNVELDSIDSRLGFKGAIPLDGGLTGTYKFEFGVAAADEGSEEYDVVIDDTVTVANVNDTISVANESGITRRNMYLGLKGGFGEVRLGRHDSPLKMAQGKFDQFGDTVGDLKFAGDEDGENRNDSSLTYLGKFDKLAVNVQLVPGEGDGITSGNGLSDTTSIAVSYTDGPLYVAVANDSYDSTGAVAAEDSLTRIVATYKMNDMQFGLLSQSGVESVESASAKEDWLGLSFNMKMGNNKLKFQHITVEDSDPTGALESTHTSFGIDHKLGKKGTVYAMYNTIEEKYPTAKETDKSQLSVGYILKF